MGVKAFLKKVFSIGKKVAVKVSEVFIAVFGEEKAGAFAHAALALLSTRIGSIVREEVAKQEAVLPAQPGAVKLAQAIAAITLRAPKEVKYVGANILNMLIETAVAEAAGHFAPDTDGDGIPDFLDSDDDNDGVKDKDDPEPKNPAVK